MVNTIPSEAKGESVSANSLYGMVLETPSPSVQVTVNLEDQDETVKHTKPEDAAKYVQAFEMGSGQDIHPSGLPDPEEFATENVSYSAQADDTLGYTITITGRSDIEGGSVAKDDQGDEYVIGEDGDTAYLEGSKITLESEVPAERVNPQYTEDFRDAVRKLGGQ